MMKTEKILEYPVYSGPVEELIEQLVGIVEGGREEGPWTEDRGLRTKGQRRRTMDHGR